MGYIGYELRRASKVFPTLNVRIRKKNGNENNEAKIIKIK